MKLLVLTFANFRNQFLDEWEASLVKNNIDYKILGLGDEWEGFQSKTKYFCKEITEISNNINNNVHDDYIIILCDSFDLFFNATNDEILKKYMNITNNKKILIGSESYCKGNCYNKQNICFNNTKTTNEEKFPYINSGFIMGNLNMLSNACKYLIKSKINDDQIAWGYYRAFNCNKVILDYNSEMVLNLAYEDIDKYELKYIDYRVFNVTKNNFPCAVHLPGQIRTFPKGELIRNNIFPYRNTVNEENYNTLNKIKYKY